jgi:hypothetical protein
LTAAARIRGMALPAICMLIVIFVFAAGGYIASR